MNWALPMCGHDRKQVTKLVRQERAPARPKLTAVPWWSWFLLAVATAAVGATLWFTAFVLWPASLVMIVAGVVKLARVPPPDPPTSN
jgi:hypothetical protein